MPPPPIRPSRTESQRTPAFNRLFQQNRRISALALQPMWMLDTRRPSREAAMKIETRKVNDVLVVDMAGRLDSLSSGEAGDRIVHIVQGDNPQILLNLDEVEYVSSAGLQIILRGSKLLGGN